MLASILRDHNLEYHGRAPLQAGRPLPYGLDFFALKFALTPRA
jgi:hypothetical protein